MKQEDKELLFKDLCARLPYGVRCKHFTWDDKCGEECMTAKIYSINSNGYVENCYEDYTYYIENVRPYLFPLASMTDKQKNEYQYITERWMYDSAYSISDSIDWLNKNHFDYRGLIEDGLAIDATGLGIYQLMKATDVSYQKLTGEWNKHIRKRKGLKKLYNKKRRAFLKKLFNKLEI